MRRRILILLPVLAIGALVVVLVAGGQGPEPIDPLGGDAPERFSELSVDTLESRATDGLAHVLYAKSPGGVLASAERTARWRGLVEQAAEESGSDPDLLEAMVFLESAGRPDAQAGGVEAASGLTQILAATATDFLDMHVDAEASERLTARIARAERRGRDGEARRLRAGRRRVDERFDPELALAGAGRYLETAREVFGREDLAVVSYHMGIGNLESVLRAFAGPDGDDETADLVEDDDLSYARVYFDSGPDRHDAAWELLAGFGDDSSVYLWRVLAARKIMRLWREDRRRLAGLSALHLAKGSTEEVLHPGPATEVFDDPGELELAYGSGDVRRVPDEPARFGLRRDPRMGRLAARLGRPPSLYRGLRPGALAMAAWMGRRVRELSGSDAALTVTSTVRDRRYQRLLVGANREATRRYSLHTTGYAFDVRREYPGPGQAEAFQFVLDRLQALNLIAWVREPGAIHVTVSREGRAFLPVLED